MHRATWVAVAAALSVLPLEGCGTPAAEGCGQPALVLGTSTPVAGAELAVSAPGFGCGDLPYPAGRTYRLLFSPRDATRTAEVGTATPARDGSFSTTVRLPDDAAGPGSLRVLDADRGAPTCGPAESCASWAAELTVQAPAGRVAHGGDRPPGSSSTAPDGEFPGRGETGA